MFYPNIQDKFLTFLKNLVKLFLSRHFTTSNKIIIISITIIITGITIIIIFPLFIIFLITILINIIQFFIKTNSVSFLEIKSKLSILFNFFYRYYSQIYLFIIIKIAKFKIKTNTLFSFESFTLQVEVPCIHIIIFSFYVLIILFL